MINKTDLYQVAFEAKELQNLQEQIEEKKDILLLESVNAFKTNAPNCIDLIVKILKLNRELTQIDKDLQHIELKVEDSCIWWDDQNKRALHHIQENDEIDPYEQW